MLLDVSFEVLPHEAAPDCGLDPHGSQMLGEFRLHQRSSVRRYRADTRLGERVTNDWLELVGILYTAAAPSGADEGWEELGSRARGGRQTVCLDQRGRQGADVLLSSTQAETGSGSVLRGAVRGRGIEFVPWCGNGARHWEVSGTGVQQVRVRVRFLGEVYNKKIKEGYEIVKV